MKKISYNIGFVLLMLTPLCTFCQSEDFFRFINVFSQDTTFQKSRILFPLEVISWDYEKDCEVVIKMYKNSSKFFPIINYNSTCSDGYFFVYPNVPIEGSEMILDVKGTTDNSEKYWFVLKDDKWYLTRYRNYDYEY